MKCIINQKEYTAVDNVSFSPQTSLTMDNLPINQFEVRIFTNDIIDYGQYCELRDDLDNLWARYWISYAERIGQDVDKGTYIVKVIAQSSLAFLERIKIPAKMYNTNAYAVLTDILQLSGQSGAVTLDADTQTEWSNIQINGFCQEQTARERFLWLMLCTGGYIKSFFDTGIKVEKLETEEPKLIPFESTYWKPTISHRDYVTQIKIHAYNYINTTPHNTDTYVTDGTTYWVQEEQIITLTNSFAPSSVPENIIEIENVTLVNANIASVIIQNLVAYYFNRMEVNLEVIDNGDYIPGDLVIAYTDEDKLVRGYIDQVGFAFGVQAKGNIHLTAATEIEGAFLTIVYKWNETVIAKQSIFLPKNYEYSVTTKYHDWTMGGHRYIFRPLQDAVSGTLTENTTVTVQCEVALDLYKINDNDAVRNSLQNDKSAILEYLNDYYQEKIIMDGDEARNKLAVVRKEVTDTYSEMIDDVEKYTDVLHIKSVDEITTEETEKVDIS